MPTLLKRLCGGFLLLLLLLPALQAKLGWINDMPLDGVFEVAPHPELSAAGLRDNSYQPALEQYLEDRIGFRGLLIRLRNQLGYSVFDESRAASLAVGRDKHLFGWDYINAYLGRSFVGEDVVRFNVRRLRSVQDSLARHGVPLVFVIAPSKVTFMPENLPWRARQQPRTRTNYAAYAAAMQAAGVPSDWWCVDLCFWPDAWAVTADSKKYLDKLRDKYAAA